MRAWPAILVLLLAGCANPPANDPGANPDGANPPAGSPVVLAILDSEACDYNDLIWLMPATEVQGFLPPGFAARDDLFADGMGATRVVPLARCVTPRTH